MRILADAKRCSMSGTSRLVALVSAGLLAVTSFVVVAGATPATASTCAGTAPSDFNGDGISDAAIGEFSSAPGGHGVVHVIYGTRSGLTAGASGSALDDQLLTDTAAVDTAFGNRVATGDFNGDGCSDLAVASLVATDSAGHASGVVHLYYGSPAGLQQTSTIALSEVGVGSGAAADNDNFGTGMAVGDFTGDGITDLAVGAPWAQPGGAVFVFPGSRVYSPVVGARRFSEGDGTVPGVDETGDQFGYSLAAGDFNSDGHTDLAIGAPGENAKKGAVFALQGGGGAAIFAGSHIWTQDSNGILGTAEAGDEFGFSLATGSFKGNGRTDLAIGVPYETVDATNAAGSVNVLYSSGTGGLTSAGNQLWTQNSPGLGGAAQPNVWFGFALAAGDFNGDGKSDLAIGAPEEVVSGADAAGTVKVIPGSAGGLTAAGSSTWNQDTAGIPGVAQFPDSLGRSITALRVTSASHDDLLVGVPSEGVSGVKFAGAVELILGSSTGLTATGSQLWSADSNGIKGTSCASCGFGAAVA
jgi:FG-GAP repeat